METELDLSILKSGLPLLVVVWLLKWFVMFLYCCSAWIFYSAGQCAVRQRQCFPFLM